MTGHESLRGKTAVITGGGGVLCGAFSRFLASAGVKVAVLDFNAEAAKKTADDIIFEGGEALPVVCDVLDEKGLFDAKKKIEEKLGPCDILINGAGGNNPLGTTSKDKLEKSDLEEKTDDIKTFFDLDAKGVSHVFDLNFLGTLLVTKVFSRDMAKRGGGVIINVSSMNAFRPLTRIPAYSAAKAAVSNLTQFMAVHFSSVGIRVNAIAPGFFSTKQNKTLLFNPDGSLTKRSEKIIDNTPMGRFGVPEDLKGALLFLADDESSGFITGVVLPVDGGFNAYSGV